MDIEGKTGNYPIFGAAGYIGNVDFYHLAKPYVAVVKDGAGIWKDNFFTGEFFDYRYYAVPSSQRVFSQNIFAMWFDICILISISLEQQSHIYFRDYRMKSSTLMISDDRLKLLIFLEEWKILSSEKKELQ